MPTATDEDAPEAPKGFPIDPPVEPVLAKLATELPVGESWLFEPKWMGSARSCSATTTASTSRAAI